MKKVAILIGFLPGPRMLHRIDLEKQVGEIHVICWDKGNNMLQKPKENGYAAHIISQKAGTNPIKRVIPYALFSRAALDILEQIQPDMIHVQGVDMLKIACAHQKKSKRKVHILYEIADLHRLLVDRQKNPIKWVIQKYLQHEDRRLQRSYDLLILTSMRFYEAYFQGFVSRDKVFYMPNVPDLTAFHGYVKKNNDENFTIGYIGSVRYKQQMRNLLDAVEQVGGHLLIAGFESEPIEIEPLCKNNPNIEWVGRFDFEKQAAELYGKCDVMYSVYDADMHNVRVALPNKLYEAVCCEMPIIVAKNTYLAQVVEEWGVGVAVDHKSVDELAEALRELRDNRNLREQIAENCRKHKGEIDLQKYNAQLKDKIVQILGESN